MEKNAEWTSYLNEICYPVEKYLLGFAVRDKKRLVSAIISNAFLNEKIEFEELKEIPLDSSLETRGDFVLDFVIFDNFALNGDYTLATSAAILYLNNWIGNWIELRTKTSGMGV